MTDSSQLPASIEAEKSLLSMIMLDPAVLNQVVERIRPEHFYQPAHGLIYKALMDLSERDETINRLSLKAEIEKEHDIKVIGGEVTLWDLESWEADTSGLDYYVRTVRGKALVRDMVGAARSIMDEGLADSQDPEQYVNWAEKLVYDVAQDEIRPSYHLLKDVLKTLMEEVVARRDNKKPLRAIPTGFRDLDEKLGGLHPTDLIILAARPAMGKTAFALNLASSAALDAGKSVVVFSLEMAAAQLAMRLISTESVRHASNSQGINSRSLIDGKLTAEQMTLFASLIPKLAGANIVVDDTPALSVIDLRARARRLKAEGRCDLIIVDYLQLMRGGRDTPSREQEVAEISRSMKALAKELDVPVIALSQLNRMLESRSDKRPQLADLRESGSIEQDADVILFIYRDEVYNKDKSEQKGIAEIIIGKHRNGDIGKVNLRFNRKFTRFETLAKEQYFD